VVRLTPKPVIQLLVRNCHPKLLRTPCHRLPYRPKPPFRYRLLHPPLLLPRPYLSAFGPTPQPVPPYLLYTPRLMPLHPSLNRHMCYSHHLPYSLQPLPLSQHPQRLPSLGYPSLYCLLVKLVKHFLPDASKLSAMAMPYLLSFGWGKNTSHRKWYYLSGG